MNILPEKDRYHLTKLGGFAGQHPAMLLTLFYLLVSFLGLSFSWAFYAQFGIDYFDYAEIGDFILAAFREPVTFLLALSSLAIGIVLLVFQWLVNNFYDRFRERSRFIAALSRFDNGLNRWGVLPTIIVLFFVYCVIFISDHAGDKADDFREGRGERVLVHYADPLSDGESSELAAMLGSSTHVIFLYEPARKRVRIVPMDAIVAIEKAGPSHASEAQDRKDTSQDNQTETVEKNDDAGSTGND